MDDILESFFFFFSLSFSLVICHLLSYCFPRFYIFLSSFNVHFGLAGCLLVLFGLTVGEIWLFPTALCSFKGVYTCPGRLFSLYVLRMENLDE